MATSASFKQWHSLMNDSPSNDWFDGLVPRDEGLLAAFWKAQQSRLAAALAEKVPDGSTVAMLDYPVHPNTGDHLIMLGADCWATKRLNIVGTWHADNFLRPKLPPETILVCHGGGNFGDLYRYQEHRERLLQNYPDHRIVILPQTVYFKDRAKEQAAGRAMSAHGDVHLFVRDETSLEIAERSFASCSPALAPDMAAFLYPLEETLRCKLPEEIIQEVFFLARRDKERVDLSRFPALAGTRPVDWDDLQPLHFPFIIGVLVCAYVYARVIPAGPFFRWWREYCRKRAVVAAGRLKQSRYVVTNRLHCHILARLLGVPNIVLDNTYAKNSAYYRCWHKKLPFARFVEG